MTLARSPVIPNVTNTSAGRVPSLPLGAAAACARRLVVVDIRSLPRCRWCVYRYGSRCPARHPHPERMRSGARSRLTLPSMVVADDPRILELSSPERDLVAQFANHAGMVGCSLRHQGEELLGLGGGLEAYVEEGKVFGIPLLYPWANRLGGWSYDVAGRPVELDRGSPLLHGDEHCLPIHGALAATSEWTVRSAGPSELLAELDFAAHPDLLAVFPFPHRLELEIGLGVDRLTVTTTITAGAGAPVPL